MADVEMPQLGETVTEGTITKWFKQVGDHVAEDEILFEVSTDKVDSEVPSPMAGTLAEILVPEGDTVDVGTRLAVLADGDGAAPPPADDSTATTDPPGPAPTSAPVAAPPTEPAPSATPAPTRPPAPAPGPPPPRTPTHAPTVVPDRPHVASPLVRKLATDNHLDLGQVAPTGAGGRITRADVQRAVESDGAATSAPPEPRARPAGAADVAVPLSNIRRRIGEHMVMSKNVAPHAMTVVDVDYEAVERVRRQHGEQWRADEGFSLTYLPFIARAVIDALHDYPHLNATVADGELILHNYVNLAIAVDLDFEGLLAPVIHDADQKRLRAIAREIRDLADRARSKQLSADEIVGGTFTLTNAGSYGTHMIIPVINQPQVGILSTDGVSRKPVVVTDESGGESIAIHSTGLLPLAWDHRAFDGAYSAAFMARVREILETRDWAAEL
jgi:2-oxoglutarate dehydrogenase E2 component (dihydrolipoamide succinyltransferase)